MQKLNWLINGARLRFLNAGQDSVQDERCRLKNKKLDLWLKPWSQTSSYNLDFEPSVPCNSELLKQSKSSRWKMFFKRGIASLKNFAMFTLLRWGLFVMHMQAFKPATFSKRDYSTGFSCGYCEIFKSSFFIVHLRWMLLAVLP